MSIALPFVLVFLSLSFTISYPVYFLISGIMVKRVRSDRPLLNTFACWMPAQFICCLWFALEVYSITWTTRGINLLSIILDWLFIAFFIMCSNIAMLILATLTGKFRRVMLFVFAAVMTAAAIFNIVTYDTGEGIYFIILMALWLLLHAIFYNWYEMKAMKVKAVKISAAVLHYILLFMLILVMGLSAATNIIPIANGDEHSVIVLGAPVHNNKASTILEDRISVASGYLKKNEAAYAILTGGTKVEGGKTEAETIRDGLVANGISEDRLVLESDAKTTEENFEKSLAIVEKYGGSANEEIVIITSSFHLLRAAIFAQNAGFTKLTGLGADSFFMKDWVWYLREAVSLLPVLLR